ncbi:MAG: GNAT family N-acetyltransferase [Anaeromicrobium sp.]|jgi:ribosomal protein S18 acetylase RimI-like enzyme|uniref:GNAT family N-acetyltransferase n=1 Tax=Anaeromicrobium sp. TaxID=1929132 RepID=UPI0025D74122|nr:GNAT family N-acetyltransferase [Anaeromicrobium sp.]MCT4595761.1 GNAT family N-acetyltransferase [Anaeromicrobium sp.]
MILETLRTYVDFIQDEELVSIIEIYNSNNKFLLCHMDKEKVDMNWLENEIQEMRQAGFYSCKIVEKETLKIIGLMDFSVDKESYLSLIMIHDEYKNRAYGKEVYMGLEEYLKRNKVNYIRIDVVNDYDEHVLDFWFKNGFEMVENMKLNWSGKELSAVKMKKHV